MVQLLRLKIIKSQAQPENLLKVLYLDTRPLAFFLSARKSTIYSSKVKTIHLCQLLLPLSTLSCTTRLQSTYCKTSIFHLTSTLWSRTSPTWAPKPAYTYSRQRHWIVCWEFCSRTLSPLKKSAICTKWYLWL